MNDSEKINEIKRIFEVYHNSDVDWDSIDVCMKVERIIEK